MRIILEKYETCGGSTRTDTVTIEDAKWTNDVARFLRDWCGIAKKSNDPVQTAGDGR